MSQWYGGLDYQLRGFELIEAPTKVKRGMLRRRGKYLAILGPYPTENSLRDEIKQMKIKVLGAKRLRQNPVIGNVNTEGAVEIYENIQAIEARKGRRSLWPKGDFRHDFKNRKTKIYGLKNGNLLIVGKNPLWKMFKYPKDVSEYS